MGILLGFKIRDGSNPDAGRNCKVFVNHLGLVFDEIEVFSVFLGVQGEIEASLYKQLIDYYDLVVFRCFPKRYFKISSL